MPPHLTVENTLTPTQLLDALDGLGVRFLRGAAGEFRHIEPEALLAALAASPEARLRLSLIPLLLAHPEYSTCVASALRRTSPDAAVTLRCYYTAAFWLQRKYAAQITRWLGETRPLPDLFGAELGLGSFSDPDAALNALAAQQQTLSGRALNWCGTYEHALQSWLRHRDEEARWNRSP